MNTRLLLTFSALALSAAVRLSAETTLHFHGAVMLEKMIRPVAGEIGAAHGAKLEFVPNGVGRGLSDLAAGKAQVAMFAGEVSYFAAQVNEKAPGSVDAAKLRLFPLVNVPAVLIVHPSNPVASFTPEQIRGIFGGTITNWKQLGGADLPIVAVIAAPTDGVRSVVTQLIMGNVAYAPSARVIPLSPDTNKVVAQIPGAIACISARNVVPEVRAVQPSLPIPVPYGLVTLGEPVEPLKGVIADLQARLK